MSRVTCSRWGHQRLTQAQLVMVVVQCKRGVRNEMLLGRSSKHPGIVWAGTV